MKMVFYNRDFSPRIQPNLTGNVTRLSWDRVGGCKEMTATLTGDRNEVLALINDLRSPVEVTGQEGIPVFWGFIYEVIVNDGGIQYGNSLEGLYNRVKINYSPVDSDTVYSTSWKQNNFSVEIYGKKEYIGSMSGVNADVATMKQDAMIDLFAKPTPSYNNASGDNGEVSAQIFCKGWASALNWEYVDSVPPVVGIEYADIGTNRNGVNHPVKQLFTVPAGQNQTIREVAIYANTFDQGGVHPTDNLLVKIVEYPGYLGSVLATATITPDKLTGHDGVYVPLESERITVQFDHPVELTAGTQYALHISRSGTPTDGGNYFVVMTNSALGYAGGAFTYNTGTEAWYTPSPNVDLVFTLYSDEWVGVSRQIKQVISEYAQFITGIADVTGVLDSEIQVAYPGDTTTLEVLRDYLTLGGANGRPLILNITPERLISVTEEPAQSAGYDYLLTRSGHILTKSGSPVQLSDLASVPGHYAILSDMQFAELNVIPSAIIEEIQYSDGNPRVIFKGQARIEDLEFDSSSSAKPVISAGGTTLDGSSYIRHDLATAVNDFIVATGVGAFAKKTLADTLTILGKDTASGIPSLNASSKVTQDPANATATPTANKIPIADGSGKLDGWITPGSGYTDEQAQDAVGGMVADTNSIDLTYTDATPELKADLKIQDSPSVDLSVDAGGLKAVVLPAGVSHDDLSGFVANEHLDWTADQGANNVHANNIPDLSGTYAPASKGVTNGDSHDHSGGDGGTIAYASLSGKPLVSGTSFPGSPTNYDMYFRTDLGLLCYFDGTRWLTVNEYTTPQLRGGTPDSMDTDLLKLMNSKHIYISNISAITYTSTTNDASNYYTVNLYIVPIWGYYGAMSTLLHTFDTKADGTANWADHTGCNTNRLGNSDDHLMAKITKTGSPGTMSYTFIATYRLIIT